ERVSKRLFRSPYIAVARASHDADVHPRFGDDRRRTLVSAGVDRPREQLFRLDEVRRQVMHVDGLVDLALRRHVEPALSTHRMREEGTQRQNTRYEPSKRFAA